MPAPGAATHSGPPTQPAEPASVFTIRRPRTTPSISAPPPSRWVPPPPAVTVSGTVEADRITFGAAQPPGVPVVLTGGTIRLGGTNAVPAHRAQSQHNATINSAIMLNNNVQIRGPSYAGAGGTVTTLNLNGVISGAFNVTFFGPTGNNTYSTFSWARKTLTPAALVTLRRHRGQSRKSSSESTTRCRQPRF